MPAVAGAFYPANATTLENQISNLFKKAIKVPETDVAALIVPHAGYVFSGEVAASAYAKLNRQERYKNIFIIGPSHRGYDTLISVNCRIIYNAIQSYVSIYEIWNRHNLAYIHSCNSLFDLQVNQE